MLSFATICRSVNLIDPPLASTTHIRGAGPLATVVTMTILTQHESNVPYCNANVAMARYRLFSLPPILWHLLHSLEEPTVSCVFFRKNAPQAP